jgi:hypothetical protein
MRCGCWTGVAGCLALGFEVLRDSVFSTSLGEAPFSVNSHRARSGPTHEYRKGSV